MSEYKYNYKAFGINIVSDFELEELLPADGTASVAIIKGEINVQFPGLEDENAHFCEGEDSFAFRVKGLGAFLIRGGYEIIVQMKDNSDERQLSLFILGTCMGALLLQRGLIPIHGSALALHHHQVIFTGNSGAGKSTITASLIKRGYSFLADDISALRLDDNGEAWIIPAFPSQKLCHDTADEIYGGVKGLEKIPGIRDKYFVKGSEHFITEDRRLHALVELSTHTGSEVEFEEVKGTERLAVIIRNTYRFQLVEVKGIEVQHFQLCSQIASQIKVFKLKRPMHGFTVDEQIKHIMNVLEHESV